MQYMQGKQGRLIMHHWSVLEIGLCSCMLSPVYLELSLLHKDMLMTGENPGV